LKLARVVLEQLVDDRPLPRAGRLEEGDLALRLQRDDLAQLGAGDRGVPHGIVERR
jgi:hypothetical protein